MALMKGFILNERYRVVRQLGQGGFGEVYQAWDEVLERNCAIKESLDLSTDAQRQFKREAKILANLSHPNLPRVTDYFTVPGKGQYLVMDYVQGEDLEQLLQRTGKPLPENQVIPWVAQVCDALSYLHAQNPPIIHRDIKPANIKITPLGQAVLVDFGIAKIYDPSLSTTMGARAVTPGFSPPEQYGMGTTDELSDIYALGATLYTLLTGNVPPASVDIVSGTVPVLPDIHSENPTTSPHVVTIVGRAMQLNRTARYKSADELKGALNKAVTTGGTQVIVQGSTATLQAQQAPSSTGPISQRISKGAGWGIIGMILLVVLVIAGGKAILVILAKPDINLGLALLELGKASGKISDVLGG